MSLGAGNAERRAQRPRQPPGPVSTASTRPRVGPDRPRVAPAARAWRELAMEMDGAGVTTVGALPEEVVARLADKLWIVLPGAG